MIRTGFWLSADGRRAHGVWSVRARRRSASSTSTTGRTISTSSIIEDFTKETGIKVVYDVFDSNEILETKLLAGGTGYDVVVPTGTFLARQIQAGVFQKLDKSKLPNLVQHVGRGRRAHRQIRSGQRLFRSTTCGAPPASATTSKKVQGSARHRQDRQLGRLLQAGERSPSSPIAASTCWIRPTDIIPTTLKYLGLDPDIDRRRTISPRPRRLLLKIRPSIRKFHSSEYINALANGDICLAVGWSGDVFQARDRAAEADQGVDDRLCRSRRKAREMWFDQMAIPADAPHVDEAHEFLNYMMKPEVIAKASNYVFYANGNKASQAVHRQGGARRSGDLSGRGDAGEAVHRRRHYDPKTQRLVTRIWTKIVTGQ